MYCMLAAPAQFNTVVGGLAGLLYRSDGIRGPGRVVKSCIWEFRANSPVIEGHWLVIVPGAIITDAEPVLNQLVPDVCNISR